MFSLTHKMLGFKWLFSSHNNVTASEPHFAFPSDSGLWINTEIFHTGHKNNLLREYDAIFVEFNQKMD